MQKPHLQIIIGSTRPGRAGAAVGSWFHDIAAKHDACTLEILDLATIDLPLLNEPHHPRLGRYVHDHTKRWSEIISAGDAFVFVVPEYNRGYNAATKNALDYLFREWQRKPVGFVGYGAVAAGSRSIQGLIPVVAALGMIPVTRSVNIPLINRMVTDGEFVSNPRLDESAAEMLDELSSWAADLTATRRGADR
ncbi:NAD(P)H-dependent oxidoreductase [Pseudonocardia sp.]|jgi:NAD(P)H-dependent FMN reductase|uniref:NADPH-dependent FMN reductase n=1 Tax=Pseudonocardia sp. TaxID=60912 RepID=UPI0031FC9C96